MNHTHLYLTETEIANQLGYLPAFLIPAINSSPIFRSLARQTLSSYIDNPLPNLFKEKLFVYLSRYYGLSYFTICHSCNLQSLGTNAAEILKLAKIAYPQTEQELTADLELLRSQWDANCRNWEENPQLEISLLRCSCLIFTQSFGFANCTLTLKRLLGTVYYNYLLLLLGYIKLCHQWVASHPEISHQQDRRSQLYLGTLLLSDIRLAKFVRANIKLESEQNKVVRLSKTGTQTQNTLQQIAVSFSQIAEGDRNNIEDKITQAVKNEVTINTRQGERRFRELYCTPLSDRTEREKLKIPIVKHFTKAVHSQTRLFEIKEQLDFVQDAANIGNFSFDLVNQKIIFCPRGLGILGLKSFDGNYQSFWQLIHPDARKSLDLAIIRAIESFNDLTIEFPILKSNYDICWIRLKSNLRYNLQNKPIRLTGIIMNITPQKLASSVEDPNYNQIQPQVSLSFLDLKNIIHLLPAYVCVIDPQKQTVLSINQKLANSLGLGDRELELGKNIEEYFTSDQTRRIIWQQQQVLTYGEEFRVREEVKLADGIHNFDTTVTPLSHDDGNIYALLYTSNEIPDLSATKEALSQRTLQLEAANKELESFSFSVSHDLQAPLRVINGFSQVLWENYQSHVDDRGKHYLQRIQANSEKMSDLIDALLQLSRVTRSQMKSVVVDLSQIARDITEELQARDPEREVEIKITPDLQTTGDPQLLRIVLSNLFNNAWKYTSKRSQSKVEFGAVNLADNQLAYFVRDNGAGFDLEYADKLFTAFKRLHTQEEFPGTGIGLATVQRIIYRHGGKVWAESKCDRGATIYFSL